MKALRKLYLANLTEFLSNRRALFLTIAFPVIFIVIFGAVFTNQDKAFADIGLVIEDPGDAVSQEIVKGLESAPKSDLPGGGQGDAKDAHDKNPFSELKFREGKKAALLEDLRQGRLDAIITIPAGLAKEAAAMKEQALREAAGQMEKARREQMPPPPAGAPVAIPDEAERARLAAAQALPVPAPPAPASPAPTAAATPHEAKTRAAGASRPRAGRTPGPLSSPKPTETPLPSQALTLASTPAPSLPPTPAASLPPSAPVRRVEIVEDHPEPLTPAQITLTIDPARQLLRPVVQALLAHILTSLDTHLTGQPPLAELRTESVQARELRTIDYLLPGILALSIMQLGLLATAQPLVALRVQGVLKRLSATPLPRTTLLTAYIAFRLTIAMFQTMLTVIIGRYAFKVVMVGSWWQFSGWVLLGTLVFLSIGFFMAAVSKNEESCTAVGTVLNLPMILLSGVFFPVNHLSRVWEYIIMLVPLNYLADALRTTMVDAPPLHTAGTNALVLGCWVVVMTLLAVRFFSWESR